MQVVLTDEVKIGQKVNKWTVKSLITGVNVILLKCDCDFLRKASINDFLQNKVKCSKCDKKDQKFSAVKQKIDGRTFGKWRDVKYLSRNKCLAVCGICGEEKEVRIDTLENGTSTRCVDCYLVEKNSKANERVEGQIYGGWKVLKYLGRGFCSAVCQLCKEEKKLSVYELEQGKTSKCRKCYLTERKNKADKKVEGNMYGNWKVIKNLSDGLCVAVCQLCGKQKEVYISILKRGLSNKCVDCFLLEERNKARERIMGNKYGQRKVLEYLGKNKCLAVCKLCGEEKEVFINNLKRGKADRCIDCVDRRNSRYEEELLRLFPTEIKNNKNLLGNSKLEIDLYYERNGKKIGIEFNGDYFHSENMRNDPRRHQRKTKLADKENIELIQIFEHEWLKNKEKIVIYLDRKINKREWIAVEECRVVEIESDEAVKFEELYNITGSKLVDINIALLYDNEIVAIMTFITIGKDIYEISKITIGKHNIDRGVYKLFNHFIQKYNPEVIIAYCDRLKFKGKTYKKLGFKLEENIDINYKWVRGTEVIEKENETQRIMEFLGYLKIYDSGVDKYVWCI